MHDGWQGWAHWLRAPGGTDTSKSTSKATSKATDKATDKATGTGAGEGRAQWSSEEDGVLTKLARALGNAWVAVVRAVSRLIPPPLGANNSISAAHLHVSLMRRTCR